MLIKLVRNFLAAYRGPLTVVVGLQFIGTVMALYLPSLNADIIDNGVVTGDTGYIVHIGAVMLGVALVQICCSVGAVWFGARTAMGFGRDVRAAIFHRVGTFSQREVQSFGAPSLITRETNDVQQVQMLVLMSCTLMVMAPIMMVGGIVMAIHVDVGLSWLVAVTVPVLAILLGLIITRMVPSFRLMQGRIDEVNRLLREQITGVRVVRAFVREPLETERFVKRFGVKPYTWNPFFPVNTLNLMRAAVAAQLEGVFAEYVEAAFHHMWVEPKKMDDPEVAMKALAASGLDAARLLARSQDADVKAKLIENTQSAVERGAFGSPTFFVGKEMFFGKEQLREVEELIRGG